MYSSLSDLKLYLGISGNDQDALLTSLLKTSEDLLNKLCGVDTFDKTTAEELIDLRKVYTNYYGANIILKNKPVQSINEINGEAYSGALGTDYIIVNQRKVIIKNMSINDNFGYMKIKYTRGYDRARVEGNSTIDDLPEAIKQMELMLAGGLYTTKDYQGVKSYKLGDESITFGDIGEESADNIYCSFKRIYDKYKNFILN